MKVSLSALIGMLGVVFDLVEALRPELAAHRDGRKVLRAARRARKLRDRLARLAVEYYERNIIEEEKAARLARELAIAGGETDQAKLAAM